MKRTIARTGADRRQTELSQSSQPQAKPAQPDTSQPTRPRAPFYFMPVIAMPSTKRFCTKKNTISSGSAEISAPAITTPYG